MFKLNGDIIKQLNNIYGISFKEKNKKDIKERILFFVSDKLNVYKSDCLLDTYSKCSEILIFQDNHPYLLKELFFERYKIELLNSFNPLWYANKKVKKTFTKFELDCMYNSFINKICYEAQESFLDTMNLFFEPEERPSHYFSLSKCILKNRNCSISFDLDLIKKYYKSELEDLVERLGSYVSYLKEYYFFKHGLVVNYNDSRFYFNFGSDFEKYDVRTVDINNETKKDVKGVLTYHFSKKAYDLLIKYTGGK